MSCIHDAGSGLCIGCNDFASNCANDAARFHNGSGHGLGMAACAPGCQRRERNQQWNISADKTLRKSDGSCLEALSTGDQVVSQQPRRCNGSSAQQWQRVMPTASGAKGVEYVQLASAAHPGRCLAAGPQVQYPMDSFCADSVNMWRSSTDTLQVPTHTLPTHLHSLTHSLT